MIELEKEIQNKDFSIKGAYRFNSLAESYLLSALFEHPSLILECPKLISDDFFRLEHRIIFSETKKVFEENNTILPSLVIEKLKKYKHIDKYVDELNEIANTSVGKQNFFLFLKIITDCSKRRKIAHLGKELIELSNYSDINELMEKTEKVFMNIVSKNSLEKKFKISEENSKYTKEFLNDLFSPNIVSPSIRTHFSYLDCIFNGFFPSEVTVIASRTGMGKTSLALSLMLNISKFQKKNILFFSLEMSKYHIFSRIISNITNVPLSNILKKRLNEEDNKSLNDVENKLKDLNITIFDIPNLSISELKSISRMEYLNDKLDMIFIDYIQLISSDKRNENRQSELASITCEIKQLARELDLPIVILSQLSRATEQTEDKKPNIWNIKSSGAIEEHFDNILLVYRKDYYGLQNEKAKFIRKDLSNTNNDIINLTDQNKSNDFFKVNHMTELIVAKQRNGGNGKALLFFKSLYSSFIDYYEDII